MGLAVVVVVGLAKAIWETDSVSPRLAFRPTAPATALRMAGIDAAGTDLSTSTDTVWLLTAPGAITLWVTVLLTPKVVFEVLFW